MDSLLNLSHPAQFQVFGDRSLAEHEVVGVLAAQLQAASGSGAADSSRHIYVRLRDIDAVSLTTRAQRTLSLRSPTADSGGGLHGGSSFVGGRKGVVGPRSALTALLDEDSSRCAAHGCSVSRVLHVPDTALFGSPSGLAYPSCLDTA